MPGVIHKSILASVLATTAIGTACAGVGVAAASPAAASCSSATTAPIELAVHQGRRYAYININVTGGTPEIHNWAPGPSHTDRTSGCALHVDADVTYSPERGIYKEHKAHYELTEDQVGDVLVNGQPIPLNVPQHNDAGTLTRTGDHSLVLELDSGW